MWFVSEHFWLKKPIEFVSNSFASACISFAFKVYTPNNGHTLFNDRFHCVVRSVGVIFAHRHLLWICGEEKTKQCRRIFARHKTNYLIPGVDLADCFVSNSREKCSGYVQCFWSYLSNHSNLLIHRHISGITLLGLPMEIYSYGIQFWVSILSALAVNENWIKQFGCRCR